MKYFFGLPSILNQEDPQIEAFQEILSRKIVPWFPKVAVAVGVHSCNNYLERELLDFNLMTMSVEKFEDKNGKKCVCGQESGDCSTMWHFKVWEKRLLYRLTVEQNFSQRDVATTKQFFYHHENIPFLFSDTILRMKDILQNMASKQKNGSFEKEGNIWPIIFCFWKQIIQTCLQTETILTLLSIRQWLIK